MTSAVNVRRQLIPVIFISISFIIQSDASNNCGSGKIRLLLLRYDMMMTPATLPYVWWSHTLCSTL